MFIVIEGAKAVGKTTQLELLIQRLRDMGKTVEQLKFPRYGQKSAEVADEYLKGVYGKDADAIHPKLISLGFMIDRFGAAEHIRSLLAANTIVVADRYVASNMAFQGAKISDEEERNKFYDFEEHYEFELFKIPKPDVSFIITLKPDLAVERLKRREQQNGKGGDIHTQTLDQFHRIDRGYRELAARYPEYHLIEGTNERELSIANIHDQIWSTLEPHFR